MNDSNTVRYAYRGDNPAFKDCEIVEVSLFKNRPFKIIGKAARKFTDIFGRERWKDFESFYYMSWVGFVNDWYVIREDI